MHDVYNLGGVTEYVDCIVVCDNGSHRFYKKIMGVEVTVKGCDYGTLLCEWTAWGSTIKDPTYL